jgi:hypothetical protein
MLFCFLLTFICTNRYIYNYMAYCEASLVVGMGRMAGRAQTTCRDTSFGLRYVLFILFSFLLMFIFINRLITTTTRLDTPRQDTVSHTTPDHDMTKRAPCHVKTATSRWRRQSHRYDAIDMTLCYTQIILVDIIILVRIKFNEVEICQDRLKPVETGLQPVAWKTGYDRLRF